MSYLAIEDFRFGMDRRRSRAVGVPGTLWTLENGVITRGGDIERAKKFVPEYALPSDTFGLAALRGRPWVFGSRAAPPMPVGVQYQRLVAPGAANMTAVLDAKAVDGRLYVVAQYDDGNVHHFFDGVRVTDWDTIADDAIVDMTGAVEATTEYLADKVGQSAAFDVAVSSKRSFTIRAVTPGVALLGGVYPYGPITWSVLQPNVPEVPEVRATGTLTIIGGSAAPGSNRIVSIVAGAASLLAHPVDWTLSNEATASRVANAINDQAHISGYTAAAAGETVTITAAPGTGATPNGYTVAVSVEGDVATTSADMSGGVSYVAPVAHVVEVKLAEALDTDPMRVTVGSSAENVASTTQTTIKTPFVGTSVLVHKRRVYATAGSLLRYTQINDFADWTTIAVPASDAGFINMANESEGAERLVAAAPYNGFVAVFSGESIRIWTIETDAEQNALEQVLENTGTRAPRSVVSYGDTDVFYLDESGIRSIRARDGYDSGYVSDIGSAIDPFVQQVIKEVGPVVAGRACGVVDPVDGRYLLSIGNRIICLSYFPGARITAWSYMDLGAEITDLIRARRRVLARAGDTIYVYGGLTGDTYPADDEFETVVETPFMSANDPAAIKMLNGFDMAVEGEWVAEVLVDPNDTSKAISVGTVNRTTYHLPPAKLPGRTSHVAFRFTCRRGGPAKIMNVAIHFEKDKAE